MMQLQEKESYIRKLRGDILTTCLDARHKDELTIAEVERALRQVIEDFEIYCLINHWRVQK